MTYLNGCWEDQNISLLSNINQLLPNYTLIFQFFIWDDGGTN